MTYEYYVHLATFPNSLSRRNLAYLDELKDILSWEIVSTYGTGILSSH